MAPGALLTDWPEVAAGGRETGGGGVRVGGSSAVAVKGLLLAQSCELHSSQAALDLGLTATLIIAQPDSAAGPVCLSPVLNHSISAAAATERGGEGGRRRRRGRRRRWRSRVCITLFSEINRRAA